MHARPLAKNQLRNVGRTYCGFMAVKRLLHLNPLPRRSSWTQPWTSKSEMRHFRHQHRPSSQDHLPSWLASLFIDTASCRQLRSQLRFAVGIFGGERKGFGSHLNQNALFSYRHVDSSSSAASYIRTTVYADVPMLSIIHQTTRSPTIVWNSSSMMLSSSRSLASILFTFVGLLQTCSFAQANTEWFIDGIDNAKCHDQAMKLLEEAGIYVLAVCDIALSFKQS